MKFLSKENKIALFIGIFSFFFALFYNEWNLSILKTEAPQKVNSHNTIRTPDDASYLSPAKTFYETGIWKSGGIGKQSYFFRTPGYGLYRLCLMYFVGYDASFALAKFLQLLLFASSCVLLYKISVRYLDSPKLALCLSLIYGGTPFTCSFLYYNITESITPALLILFYFLLLQAEKSNKKKLLFLFLSAVVMSFLILVRPVLGLFLLALPFSIYTIYFKKGEQRFALLLTSLVLIISLSSIGVWAYRSYTITGKAIELQPQFYIENNSPFRPSHKAILDFSLAFGMNITEIDSLLLPIWNAAIKGDTSSKYVEAYLAKVPRHVVQTIGKDSLFSSLKKHQAAILWQKKYYDVTLPMPDTIPFQEQKVVNDFRHFTKLYQEKYFLENHVIVPLLLLKKFAFHSNLSLHIFQKTYRGNLLLEVCRGFFFLLHVACFVFCVLNLFLIKDWNGKLLFSGIVLIYLFYLVSIHRLFEERYTLPVLPLMLIGLFYSAQKLLQHFIMKRE
jgi:hypothetical protein